MITVYNSLGHPMEPFRVELRKCAAALLLLRNPHSEACHSDLPYCPLPAEWSGPLVTARARRDDLCSCASSAACRGDDGMLVWP